MIFYVDVVKEIESIIGTSIDNIWKESVSSEIQEQPGDSGVFLLASIEYLSRQEKVNFKAIHITDFRLQLYGQMQSGKVERLCNY